MDIFGRNIKEKYWGWLNDLIKKDIHAKTFSYSVCMINIDYDMNIGTLIRNANFYGCKEVYYVSDKKKYDPRGAVGTHKYTHVNYLKNLNNLRDIMKDKYVVAIENNIKYKTHELKMFKWPREHVLMLFGSEGAGLPTEVLDAAQAIVELPSYGSVRSLNVGACSSAVFYDYVSKL